MFLFGKKKTDDTLCAVFDIGSGSVGGALVLLSERGAPKVLYTIRVPIVFQKDLDFKRFTSSMAKSLSSVSEALGTVGIKKSLASGVRSKRIEKVLCVLASPWYVAESKIIRLAKKNPVVLSDRFLRDVIASEESEFASSSKVSYSEKTKSRPVVLEHSVIDIKLNGYSIKDPRNKKATDIEMSLFMSVISDDVLASVKNILEKHFHTEDISFHSFALSSFASLRDSFPEVSDFILFDMSAEVSDFFLVKDSKLLDNVSFPLGTNHLIRAIMGHFGTTSDHAYSALNLISENKLEESLKSEADEIINDVSSNWRKLATEALSKLEEKSALPLHIFTLTAPRFSLFAESFVRELWKETGQSVPKIEVLTHEAVKNSVHIVGDTKPDVFLTLDSIYAQKIFGKKKALLVG
jgi:hypothetical protein